MLVLENVSEMSVFHGIPPANDEANVGTGVHEPGEQSDEGSYGSEPSDHRFLESVDDDRDDRFGVGIEHVPEALGKLLLEVSDLPLIEAPRALAAMETTH